MDEHVHDFPKTQAEAERWLDAFWDLPSGEAYPCQYGHLGCSTRAGGPCLDEIMGQYRLDDYKL